MQRLELVPNEGDVLEVLQRFLNVHFQHLRDRLAFVADLQRLAVEAMPFTDRAGDPHVGQEIHLQLRRSVPFAGLAAAAADVEAEPARLVSTRFRLGQLGMEPADLVEDLDVGGRVRARRPSDRRLIDGDHPVEVFQAVDPPMHARVADAAVEVAAQGLDQYVADQRAFARAGDARDADERAERDFDVDPLEVVVGGFSDHEFRFADGAAAVGYFDPPSARKELSGDAFFRGGELIDRSGGDDLPSAHTRSRAEVNHVVGRADRVLVVLDDHHGVALVAEPGERL